MKKTKPAKRATMATGTAMPIPTFDPTERPVCTVGTGVGELEVKELEVGELEVEKLEVEEPEVEELEDEEIEDVTIENAVFGDAPIVTGIDGDEDTQTYPVAVVPTVNAMQYGDWVDIHCTVLEGQTPPLLVQMEEAS